MMAELTKTRLTAAEFSNLPETMQPMELIHGEVVVSPTPKDPHQDAVGAIYAWLLYVAKPAVPGGQPKVAPLDVYLDDENVLQPDVFWIHGTESRCKLGEDGYWHGAPDLVAEVLSPGIRKRDRKTKFDLYEQHGVREYWMIDPLEILMEVFALVNGRFELLGAYEIGESLTSPVLGLNIELSAISAR
jgi:Uma2 family endonuclease